MVLSQGDGRRGREDEKGGEKSREVEMGVVRDGKSSRH